LISEEIVKALKKIVGKENVLLGEEAGEEYMHDEALTAKAIKPDIVVKPGNVEEVSKILRLANNYRISVTPRGGGTGLSGGCIAASGGIILSLERMNKILEIDEKNHVAVVEAGVTLSELYKAVENHGLCYPIYPGEATATIGGNVATNAGGMKAVKYGVTRHFVLGLEAVLPTGEIISTGGKFVKSSTGYDLTQLLIGSEGTLAVITKVILKLLPLPKFSSMLFIPFKNLNDAIQATPAIIKSGIIPVAIEFIEKFDLILLENYTGKKVPISRDAREKSEAFLLIIIEGRNFEEAIKDAELIGDVCLSHGALDVYIPDTEKAKQDLLEIRSKHFYAIKDAGAKDMIDVVVPRGEIPRFVNQVYKIGEKYNVTIRCVGHAGDGNVHLYVIGGKDDKLPELFREIYITGKMLGGTLSGEHGIGLEKRRYFLELEDKTKIELMRKIKKVFDPNNILNPGKIF